MFQVLVLSCMDERAERALGFVEKAWGRDKFGCCNDPLKLRLAFGLVCFSWNTNTRSARSWQFEFGGRARRARVGICEKHKIWWFDATLVIWYHFCATSQYGCITSCFHLHTITYNTPHLTFVYIGDHVLVACQLTQASMPQLSSTWPALAWGSRIFQSSWLGRWMSGFKKRLQRWEDGETRGCQEAEDWEKREKGWSGQQSQKMGCVDVGWRRRPPWIDWEINSAIFNLNFWKSVREMTPFLMWSYLSV